MLAAAGVIGFIGNEIAAQVRLRAGRRLHSPALVADGNHARVDGFVSLSVTASAALVGLGLPRADPLIGLAITLVILKITWDSWRVVSTTEGPAKSTRRTSTNVDRLAGERRRFGGGAPDLRSLPGSLPNGEEVKLNGGGRWSIPRCVGAVGVRAGACRALRDGRRDRLGGRAAGERGRTGRRYGAGRPVP